MIRGIMEQKAALDGFDSQEEISKISARTLVIQGTEDTMVPASFGEYVASMIKGAELVYIEGAGHIIPPAKYASKMIDFLKRNSIG